MSPFLTFFLILTLAYLIYYAVVINMELRKLRKKGNIPKEEEIIELPMPEGTEIIPKFISSEPPEPEAVPLTTNSPIANSSTENTDKSDTQDQDAIDCAADYVLDQLDEPEIHHEVAFTEVDYFDYLAEMAQPTPQKSLPTKPAEDDARDIL